MSMLLIDGSATGCNQNVRDAERMVTVVYTAHNDHVQSP